MPRLACLLLAGLSALPAAAAADEPPRVTKLVEAASGAFLGSATPVGGTRLLTNRHVVEPALRRGGRLALEHGGSTVDVCLEAMSERLDLAVLVADRPLGPAPALNREPPASGTTVATPVLDGGWVTGEMTGHRWRETWGPALFVRMPVGFGFSGGPVSDGENRLIGLITAAVDPDAQQMTTLRADRSVAAWFRRSEVPIPVVLVLPVQALIAEADRIDAGTCDRAPLLRPALAHGRQEDGRWALPR
jgi:S1-C subfamily serine protease